MPTGLRTVSSGGNIAKRKQVTVVLGLRHCLNDLVSKEPGDGKPTAYQVAKECGFSTNTIYKICADPEKPITWGTLAKLCAYFDMQPGELLSFNVDD